MFLRLFFMFLVYNPVSYVSINMINRPLTRILKGELVLHTVNWKQKDTSILKLFCDIALIWKM